MGLDDQVCDVDLHAPLPPLLVRHPKGGTAWSTCYCVMGAPDRPDMSRRDLEHNAVLLLDQEILDGCSIEIAC